MDFSNLNVTFGLTGIIPVTTYRFGNSRIEITNENEDYNFIYENCGEKKIEFMSKEIPKILEIQIKKLYEAIDITSKDIQSCIWSLQGWKRRIEK